MKRTTLRLFSLTAVFCILPVNDCFAGTAADFSGASGGSVRLGADSDTCNGTKEGAIRYNSSSNCAEYCNGTAWTCPSGGYSGPEYETHQTTTGSAGGSPFTITKPTGTAQNDLLVAVLCRDTTNSPMSAPAGWTTHRERNGGGSDNRFGIWYKVAGASEPASYDFNLNDTNESAVGTIVRISGASTSTPIGTNNFQTGNSESPAAPTITPTADRLIFVIFCYSETGTVNAPGMHTLIDNPQAGSGIGGAETSISYRENSSTAATGNIYGSGPNGGWIAEQLSINP